MDNLTKLRNIIKDSSLSDEDKDFWDEKLSVKEISSVIIGFFLEYIEAKPDDLAWLTGFLRRKFDALESGNKEALDKILKEEKEKLNSLN